MKKPGFAAVGEQNSRAARRPDLPRGAEGEIKLPFGRLDEPAISWNGDLDSLERHLESPAEARRRRQDLETILARREYRELAIRQIQVGIDMVRRWERKEPHKFRRNKNLFVIERVIAELHAWARMTTQSEWPELFQAIAEYHRLRKRTAALRFCLLRQARESAHEA